VEVKRPQLEAALEFIRDGDVLVVIRIALPARNAAKLSVVQSRSRGLSTLVLH
jgi:DNA invertase Pin-like site-specific DNA recombinase